MEKNTQSKTAGTHQSAEEGLGDRLWRTGFGSRQIAGMVCLLRGMPGAERAPLVRIRTTGETADRQIVSLGSGFQRTPAVREGGCVKGKCRSVAC